MSSMAVPSEALGARLNEMVTLGNWPWWLMESDSVVGVAVAKVPSGTAFADEEAVRALEVPVAFMPASTLLGAVSTPEEGVYCEEAVSTLEPAAAEADEE